MNGPWPQYGATSLHIYRSLWQFFYLFLSLWLFARRSFPINAVGLLFWIIFDINGVGNRQYFDMGGYFGGGSNWLQPRPPVFEE